MRPIKPGCCYTWWRDWETPAAVRWRKVLQSPMVECLDRALPLSGLGSHVIMTSHPVSGQCAGSVSPGLLVLGDGGCLSTSVVVIWFLMLK